MIMVGLSIWKAISSRSKAMVATMVIASVLFTCCFSGLICLSSLPVEAAIIEGASKEQRGINTVLLDSLLQDRSYVIDTFTGTGTTQNNPIASEYGYIGQYMFKDIVDNYDDNAMLRDGVWVYYTINDTGDVIAEIPSGLVDMFTEESWTNFIAGAQNKSYDSLLSAFFTSDYYSSASGMTLNSEFSSVAELKVRQNELKKIKKLINAGSDLAGFIDDANSQYQLDYLYDYLPSYALSLDDYLEGLKRAYNVDYEGHTQSEMIDEFRVLSFENYQNDNEVLARWQGNTNFSLILSDVKDFVSVVKTSANIIDGTISNAILFEKMIEEGASLAETLKRTQNAARENGDNGYVRVSNKYISLIDFFNNNNDDENVLDEIALITGAAVDSLWDAVTACQNKWLGKTFNYNNAVKKITYRQISNNDMLQASVYSNYYQSIASFSNILSIGAVFWNNTTGLDQVCEKILDLKRLDSIRNYAKSSFDNDLTDYYCLKLNPSSSETYYEALEEAASRVIDDLMLLKRITLTGEEIAYDMLSVFTDSIVGQLHQTLFNTEWSSNVEQMKEIAINTLVDTLIDPNALNPLTTEYNDQLEIMKTSDELYIKLTHNNQIKLIHEMAKCFLNAGIICRCATINITNNSLNPITINALELCGNLYVDGDGDVIIGSLEVNSDYVSYMGASHFCGSGPGEAKVLGTTLVRGASLDIHETAFLDGDVVITDGCINNAAILKVGGDLISSGDNPPFNYTVNNENLIYVDGDLDLNGGGLEQPYYSSHAIISVKGNADFGGGNNYGSVVFNGTKQQEVSNLSANNVEVINNCGIKYLTDAFITGKYDLHENPLEHNGFKTYLYSDSELVCPGDYGNVVLVGTTLDKNYCFDSVEMCSNGHIAACFGENAEITIYGELAIVCAPFVNYGTVSAKSIITFDGGSIYNTGELYTGRIDLGEYMGSHYDFTGLINGGLSEITDSIYLNGEYSRLMNGGILNIGDGLKTTKPYVGDDFSVLNNGMITIDGDLDLSLSGFSQESGDASITIKGNANFGDTYPYSQHGAVVFNGTKQQNIANVSAQNLDVINPEGISYLTDVDISGKYDLHGNPLEHNGFVTHLYSESELVCDGDYGKVILNGTSLTGNYVFDSLEFYDSATIEKGGSVYVRGPINVQGSFCNNGEFNVNPVYYDICDNCIVEKETGKLLLGLSAERIPEGVTSIGDYAFSGCTGLTSVTIPDSVTSIGDYAFHECADLTSVTIGNSVTSVGEGAFSGCTGLTSTSIGNGVTSIGNWAFAYCADLTNVTIPDGVMSIGLGTFYGCTGLTSVTIPESVTAIGEGTFDGCDMLKMRVYKDSVAHQYAIDNEIPFEIIGAVMKGDADGDGAITVADALIALRVAARLAEETPELLDCCDTDGDGKITVADALAILRVAAKLVDSL